MQLWLLVYSGAAVDNAPMSIGLARSSIALQARQYPIDAMLIEDLSYLHRELINRERLGNEGNARIKHAV